MVRSVATTAEAYLESLPEDQRAVVSAVRALILANLPAGYREAMNWGMLSYEIPLERYPHTYNGQPLGYVALAAQKRYYSLYLMGVYSTPDGEAGLRERFAQTGKKLDMGKSCVRFRKLEDLPLDVIAEVIASTPPEEWIARYEASRKE